jgi:hypothetical protein
MDADSGGSAAASAATAAVSDVLDAPDLFTVLGLAVGAAPPEVAKRAYYKRALQVHYNLVYTTQ